MKLVADTGIPLFTEECSATKFLAATGCFSVAKSLSFFYLDRATNSRRLMRVTYVVTPGSTWTEAGIQPYWS